MKPALLGTLVGAVIGLSAAWSCTVNRPSDNLKCTSQADCGTGRICEGGYCIVGTLPADARELDAAVCPATCNGGCDFGTTTCTITGTGSGSLVCPTGWNCNIACPTAGACGSINCTNAGPRGCDIACTTANACLSVTCGAADCKRTCTGSGACGSMTCGGGSCTQTCSGGDGACGSITCGDGACSATCQGSGALGNSACGSVTCNNSCRCDVACNDTTDICPSSMSCPRSTGQNYCTPSGTNGDRCDSSVASQCNDCP